MIGVLVPFEPTPLPRKAMISLPPSLGAIPLMIAPLAAQFSNAWQIDVPGSTTVEVALGDIDADGDLDAVLMQDLQDSVVLINQGSGYFLPLPQAPSMPRGVCGRLGHLDGDAHLDLFVTRHLAPCEVWIGDGSGGFTNSGQSLGGTASRATMALADVNGDTHLDAILPIDGSSAQNEIWLNNGSGIFSDSGQSLGLDATKSVVVGDANGDTHPDIVFGNNGVNRLWLNNGSGVFSDSGQSLGASTTNEILLRDVSGDTFPDLVMVNGSISGQDNEVWLNNGSGTFSDSGQSLGNAFSLSGTLSDLDGDDDLDLVEGTAGNEDNRVWLNNGSGIFSDSGDSLGAGRADAIATGELDCTPGDDFVLVGFEGPTEVWFSTGSGTLLDSGQRLGSFQASCGASGDLDGDGDLDVALGSLGGVIRVLLNDGGGRFTDAGLALYNGDGNNNGALAIADFNGDTLPDIVAANNFRSIGGDERDRIWLNDGAGGFTLDPDFLDDQNGSAIAVADVNGDTHIDILIGNGNSDFGDPGENSLWINDGIGNFTEVNTLGTGNTKSLAIADFDGDTELDVFVGKTGNEPNRVWLGDGAGNFTATAQGIGSSRTNVCIPFDFDGVNGIDVFCGNFNQNSVLWLNDGSASFSDSGNSFGSNPTKSAAAIDADGDGIRDLFIGNGVNNPDPDQVRTNNGSAVFTFLENLGDARTAAVLAGDFTGDGIDDVFTADTNGQHILWDRAASCPDVVAYAAGFGLAGGQTDPGADPDGDDLPNWAELAFNLNPNAIDAEPIDDFATATAGLPKLTVLDTPPTPTIRAEFIRRRNASCLDYDLTLSPCLKGFVPLGPLSVYSETINADYERVRYEFTPPEGNPRFFGRFDYRYDP